MSEVGMMDREKVIAGFEDSLANNGCGFMDGIGELFAVSGEDLQNAIALLKAHEPRLMTLDEIERLVQEQPDIPVIIEERIDDVAGWHVLVDDEDGEIVFCGFGGTGDYYRKDEYNINWRCWTSRPDEKKRAETPWE